MLIVIYLVFHGNTRKEQFVVNRDRIGVLILDIADNHRKLLDIITFYRCEVVG